MISRQAEAQKIGSLMGMAADEVSVARGMEQAAEAQKMQAIQQAAMGTVDATMGGLSLGANPVIDAQQLSSYQQARGFGGGSTMNEATLKALGLNNEQIAAIMAGKI